MADQSDSDETSGRVIDGIVRFPESNLFVLALLEEREWDGAPHVRSDFIKRVREYLTFILSGQLALAYPDSTKARIRIDLNCTHDPDEEGWNVIRGVKAEVEANGVLFGYRRLPR